MVSNLRASILKGFAAANKIHQKYGFPKDDGIGKTYLDVFNVIQHESVFLCFGALDKMHGAYVPSTSGTEGILINASHPLHVQRFTAAHELGHHVLGHKPSIDLEILGRAPLPSDNYENHSGDPEQEREADSFASAFLMPKWLIGKHLIQMGVNQNYLKSDINIYQMSLRLGVSYSAFCWCLLGHDILSAQDAKKFADIPPKEIKKKIISEDLLTQINPWANVWIINPETSGFRMLGNKNDLFVLELEENPSTGYIWDYTKFSEYGLRVLSDEIYDQHETLGAKIKRKIIFTNDELLITELPLSEKRPWNNDIYQSLHLNFSLEGRGKGFYNKVHIADAA